MEMRTIDYTISRAKNIEVALLICNLYLNVLGGPQSLKQYIKNAAHC